MELQRAKQLAESLLIKHGLTDWRFEFDRAVRRKGSCQYRKKRITLSAPIAQLNSEASTINTILHEIAHALTPGHHHDNVWRAKAIEIGCDGKRCYDSKVIATPERKYKAVCHKCGYEHKRNRQPKKPKSCGVCSKTYRDDLKLNWVQNY